jgi:UDP-glucose 4-epimerase
MILVTGGAGFIGSHVVSALRAQGRSVHIVDLQSPEPFDLRTGDIPGLLRHVAPTAIIHLAGHAIVGDSIADPRRDLETNLLPTFALLEAIRAVCPQTPLLFASTGAVYGSHAARPFTEADPVFPVPPYAVSKLAAERYCASYAAVYRLRTASLRLFSVFGPGQRKQVVYDLIRKLLADPTRLEMFGDGSQVRDFNPVANIATAFLVALDRAAFTGEVYNVGGPEALSIRTLAERLSELLGVEPAFSFTGANRTGDAECWLADCSKLLSLGYQPGVSVRQGLLETIDWVREDVRRHRSPV